MECLAKEPITIVSDGGLKKTGGFGWVIACDEEVLPKGHGPVRGSADHLTLFQSEICGMSSATQLLGNIAKKTGIKPEILMWTDNTILVRRIRNLHTNNPVRAHLENDHDLYAIIAKAIPNMKVDEIQHMKGHRDRESRNLTTTKKLNVQADKLATEALRKAKIEQPEWCEETSPLLII